ncbi:MAG: hypothetical protein WB822_23510 [Rhodoplanes sp.]
MALFEPEETVGKYWHRLIGTASTYRRYPDAAVLLSALQGRLWLRRISGLLTLSNVPLAIAMSLGKGCHLRKSQEPRNWRMVPR